MVIPLNAYVVFEKFIGYEIKQTTVLYV